MSTFLHYVHCKDALLDCSAPGGERCESLTWVDEIATWNITILKTYFSVQNVVEDPPQFIYHSPKYSQLTHFSLPMRARYEVFLWVHGLVYNMYLSLTWHVISMAQCKTAVSPLLTYWRYCSLALSHRYVIDNEGVSNTEIEIRMIK